MQTQSFRCCCLRALVSDRRFKACDYAILLTVCHLMVKRQNDGLCLCFFAFGKMSTGSIDNVTIHRAASPRTGVGIRAFPVSAHDAAPGRYSALEHVLHYMFLIHAAACSNAVALPIGSSPIRL